MRPRSRRTCSPCPRRAHPRRPPRPPSPLSLHRWRLAPAAVRSTRRTRLSSLRTALSSRRFPPRARPGIRTARSHSQSSHSASPMSRRSRTCTPSCTPSAQTYSSRHSFLRSRHPSPALPPRRAAHIATTRRSSRPKISSGSRRPSRRPHLPRAGPTARCRRSWRTSRASATCGRTHARSACSTPSCGLSSTWRTRFALRHSTVLRGSRMHRATRDAGIVSSEKCMGSELSLFPYSLHPRQSPLMILVVAFGTIWMSRFYPSIPLHCITYARYSIPHLYQIFPSACVVPIPRNNISCNTNVV
jgi:hypothetical protein